VGTACRAVGAVALALAILLPARHAAAQGAIDQAANALVAQLVDKTAKEYRAARRVHALPGPGDLSLVFFTLESFGGGNNYTYYMAAFADLAVSAKEPRGRRYRLLGFDVIGGAGWRAVDFEHFKVDGGCIVLTTREYAAGDPMSNPTRPGTARYCFADRPMQFNPALMPAGDAAPHP